MSNANQKGRGGALIGIMFVGLGALFLFAQLFNVNVWRFVWPFFIIVPGLLFFVGMMMGGKTAGPLAIPGSIVTMVGLLLLYQAITGHWESWAYAWALIFPMSVGIGLVINGSWSDVDQLVQRGMKFVTTGAIIFLIGGVFFELLFFNNVIGNVVLPVLLIGVGAFMLARRRKIPSQPMPVPSAPTEQAPPRPPAPPAAPTEPEFEPIDMGRVKK
jgi:hypothetical protein